MQELTGCMNCQFLNCTGYYLIRVAKKLYELPQWDEIFTPEKRKELYLEQKKSGTVVKAKKIGRNDPCPCGSGKKYKYCCGKNA